MHLHREHCLQGRADGLGFRIQGLGSKLGRFVHLHGEPCLQGRADGLEFKILRALKMNAAAGRRGRKPRYLFTHLIQLRVRGLGLRGWGWGGKRLGFDD